ncbi:MAG TPA: LTA synthase family protein [Candidatus Rifleibacterium sp.]|nr:LTA synthase family protein [Candidatus Rifleibacterium sp.]HPT46086.1 LTA synthase family protein [Candidatus Rifleibacterium sp.]
MKKLAGRLTQTWNDFKPLVFSGIMILAVVRIIILCLNLPTALGELWRPQLERPAWAAWSVVVILLIMAICVAFRLKKASQRLHATFMVFYGGLYLFMALCNNHVDQYGYFFQVINGRLDLEGLQSLLIMDFFFEPPWIFWNLCWMVLTGYLCRRHQRIDLLVFLWAVPFLWFKYTINNMNFVFFASTLAAGLVGACLFRSVSSARLMLYSGAVFGALFLFLNNNAIISSNTWLLALIQVSAVWILSYWFIRTCEQENTPDAIGITWLVPLAAGATLNQGLFSSPLGDSFFNCWFMLSSLNYVAGIVPGLFVLCVVAGMVNLWWRGIARTLFASGILFLTLFYLADGILMYKNGLRLTLSTLDWVWGLNNPLSILQTAFELVEWHIAILFFVFPVATIILFARSTPKNNNPAGVYRFGSLFVYLVILAQTASTGFHVMSFYPAVLGDPIRILLASLQASPLLSQPSMPLTDLLQQFSECNVTFSHLQKPSAKNTKHQKQNIVLIMLESTSTRYLSLFGHNEITWPRLESYKDRLEIFPHFFSCFPESSNADFATTSGFYPPDAILLRRLSEFNSEILVDRLKASGYDCSLYFSGFIGDTNLASYYVPRGFNRLYDANSLPGTSREDGWVWGIKEHVIAERVASQIEEQARTPEKPFFIYYRMVFPHLPFDTMSDDFPKRFSEEDYLTGSWVGRFKNYLLYQDAQVARIIEKIDKSGLRENTTIIILGDHGTALGEAGLFGHSWHLAPETMNVPLVIVHPQSAGFKVNQTTAAQIDIRPTILSLAGVDQQCADFTQGFNLLEPVPASRTIYLSSLQHRAIIEGDHYFLLQNKDPRHSMVFKLNKDDGPHRFTKQPDWPLDDLAEKYQRFSRFLRLQWNLLTHIRHFDSELNKNS